MLPTNADQGSTFLKSAMEATAYKKLAKNASVVL
jgi:hypothetical protein